LLLSFFFSPTFARPRAICVLPAASLLLACLFLACSMLHFHSTIHFKQTISLRLHAQMVLDICPHKSGASATSELLDCQDTNVWSECTTLALTYLLLRVCCCCPFLPLNCCSSSPAACCCSLDEHHFVWIPLVTPDGPGQQITIKREGGGGGKEGRRRRR
jgi:hypothetical protein